MLHLGSPVGIVLRHVSDSLALGAWHDLKARVEIDHARSQLPQYLCVAYCLRGTVRNLRREHFCTHHRVLKIGALLPRTNEISERSQNPSDKFPVSPH